MRKFARRRCRIRFGSLHVLARAGDIDSIAGWMDGYLVPDLLGLASEAKS